jgi:hypothetical protein
MSLDTLTINLWYCRQNVVEDVTVKKGRARLPDTCSVYMVADIVECIGHTTAPFDTRGAKFEVRPYCHINIDS